MAITNTAQPNKIYPQIVPVADGVPQSTVPGAADAATVTNFRALANMATAGVLPVELATASGTAWYVIPVLRNA